MNIRQYKKRYLICKDDNGKNIYVGDTVEVHSPMETKSSHQSVVHWNMLDGAFIDSHPGHRKMGMNYHRDLRFYLNQDEVPLYNTNEDEPEMVRGYCKKVKSFNKL